MVASQRKITAFQTRFGIPISYGRVWVKIHGLSASQTEIACFLDSSPPVDWSFTGHKSLVSVKTNDVFHKLIHRHDWMAERLVRKWEIWKSIM